MKAYSKSWLFAANAIAATAAFAFFMLSSSVQPLYPFGGIEMEDRTPAFQWTGSAASYVLLIDDDPAFGSPLSYDVRGTSYEAQELEFGEYWWKVRCGMSESTPVRFSVVSSVALSHQQEDAVTNAGNTELTVHMSSVTGDVTLAVNESIEIEEGENVKAEQK